MNNELNEGIIRALVAISGLAPSRLLTRRELTPTERAMSHAERHGQWKEVDRYDAPRFEEAPTEENLWPESYFSDTAEEEFVSDIGDEENAKPVITAQKLGFTQSYWDPAKRKRQSWQD